MDFKNSAMKAIKTLVKQVLESVPDYLQFHAKKYRDKCIVQCRASLDRIRIIPGVEDRGTLGLFLPSN